MSHVAQRDYDFDFPRARDRKVFMSKMKQLLPAGYVCCSVLQCVVVCCSVLQCVAVCEKEATFAGRVDVLQCVAVCRSVLQRVAACCSVLQFAKMKQLLPAGYVRCSGLQ